MGARFVQTTRDKAAPAGTEPPADPVLVIAHHPSLARVGEAFVLRDRVTDVGRLTPLFDRSASSDVAPLDDPFVSRTPIVIRRIDQDRKPDQARSASGDADLDAGRADAGRADGGRGDLPYELEIDANGVELAIAGIAIAGRRRISATELADGIDLVLGGRVVLWLTTTRDHAGLSDELGMVGGSRVLAELRAGVRELAPSRDDARMGANGPILILGETGTGKELVARAIHAAVRPDHPYVAINVAAIPAAVATAELFGHEKGAFTGATERRAGYFERAASGVLFLDEIGDLPESVQPILLRVLESNEIQPVGGGPRRVDALVVAATDADLDHAVAAGRFRGPLFHRLAAITLHVPALRDRRGDIGPLLAKFLIDELALGHAALDRTIDPTSWLPAPLVAELIRATWPGNIRQLRAVALRLAAIARAGRVATLDALGPGLGIEDVAADEPAQPLEGTAMRGVGWRSGDPNDERSTSDDGRIASDRVAIDEATLHATLRDHRFQLARTAEALGISRTHLDALIAKSTSLRKAKDLTSEQIAAARAQLTATGDSPADDLDALAAALEVSPRGLRLRLRQLDVE